MLSSPWAKVVHAFLDKHYVLVSLVLGCIISYFVNRKTKPRAKERPPMPPGYNPFNMPTDICDCTIRVCRLVCFTMLWG